MLHLAKLNKKSVKVIGNHHSPSDIACTSDYMVSLKHLNRVLEVELSNFKDTVYVHHSVNLSAFSPVLMCLHCIRCPLYLIQLSFDIALLTGSSEVHLHASAAQMQ